ncbi:MAG: AAA family ATPase [Candidatus Melainabacteria bacterium]|nr:AAA family ATPase [Candidatus Melainabacteria bacterium]
MAKFQIALKSYLVEQKRVGLEKMLSALLRRQITVSKLIMELGLSKQDVETLELKSIGRISEGLIEYIEQSLGAIEGGHRRYSIIERYYGLDGFLPARLSAMSARYGISRERVRQLKERALAHWRNPRQMEYLSQALRLLCYRNASYSFSPTPASSQVIDFSVKQNQTPVQLTEAQQAALDKVSLMKGGIITGCAGSGKTLVAIELAKKLGSENKKVLLTCFNRALADHLQEVLHGCPGVTIASFHALCLRFAKATKVSVPGGWNQRSFLDKFPEMLKLATMRDERLRFDAVIVDEAQEFHQNWWHALKSCLKPASSELYSFLDDNKLLSSLNFQAAAHLPVSIRCKGNLGLLAREFYVSTNELEVVDAPVRNNLMPEFFQCQSEEEVQATASYVIANWVQEKNINAQDIVVLTPRLPKFSKIYQTRLKNGLRFVTRKSKVDNHIWLSRISNFKGLERKAVLILDLDSKFDMLGELDRAQLMYMATSRATEHLCIIGSSDTWNFLHGDFARRVNIYDEPKELIGTIGNTTYPANYRHSDR